MLPTFLIIGAMKAGTSSLYYYLRQHPQVFMPATKELNFFVEEMAWSRGVEWYESMFSPAADKDAVAVGEASPSYTMHPALTGVPERIRATVPDVRLLYLVREPIERLRSNYLHAVADGTETKPVDEALLADPRYLDATRYAMQVERYLECFPAGQLLVLPSERLRDERVATINRVARFIGVPEDWQPADLEERHNADLKRQARGPLRALQQVPGYQQLRRLAPTGLRQVYSRAVTKPVDRSSAELRPDTVAKIRDLLAPDVARLSQYVDGGFDAWGWPV